MNSRINFFLFLFLSFSSSVFSQRIVVQDPPLVLDEPVSIKSSSSDASLAELWFKLQCNSTEVLDFLNSNFKTEEEFALATFTIRGHFFKVINQLASEELNNSIYQEVLNQVLSNLDSKEIIEIVSNKDQSKGASMTNKSLNGPCSNPDFEMCDFSDWEMFSGFVGGSVFGFNSPNPEMTFSTLSISSNTLPIQHNIVIDGDDYYGGFQRVHNSGTCSALLGDFNGIGSYASQIEKKFLVEEDNALLILNYAVVLEDPSHEPIDQPYFKVRVYDEEGNLLPCGNYEAYAGDGQAGWITAPNTSVRYLPWKIVLIPLDNYIGQNVKVEFTVGDCGQGGHFGYAYVDAVCSSLELKVDNYPVCTFPVELTAPPGGLTYDWSNGSENQSIEVTDNGHFDVSIVPVFGGNTCAVNLAGDIFIDYSFEIPNIISKPSLVGNDVFKIDYNCIQLSKFVILNRWGNIVFETNDPTQFWDGTDNGEPCVSGVYFYLFYGSDPKGIQIEKQGIIELIAE